MLWRALLAAVAISYLICVLFLSGLQKEDLDVSLLKKLQQHNVDLDDFTNDKLRKECLNKSDNKPIEEIEGDKVHGRATLITTGSSSTRNDSLDKLDTTELETVLIYLKNRKRSQKSSDSVNSDSKDTKNNKNTEKEQFFDITMTKSKNKTESSKENLSRIKFWKTYMKLLESNEQGTEINSPIEVTTHNDVSGNSSEYNEGQERKLLAEYLTKKIKYLDQITNAQTIQNYTKKDQFTTTKQPVLKNEESKQQFDVTTTTKTEENVVTPRGTKNEQYSPENTTQPKENYIPRTQQHLAEGIVILTRQSLNGISGSLRNEELQSTTYSKKSHHLLTDNIKKPVDHIHTTESSEYNLNNNHSNVKNLYSEMNYEYENEKKPTKLMRIVQNNTPQTRNPTTDEKHQPRGYQHTSQNLFINFNKNSGSQQEVNENVAPFQNEANNMEHGRHQDTVKPISTENHSPVILIQREPDRHNQQVQNNDDRQFQQNFHPQFSQSQDVVDHRLQNVDDNGYHHKNLYTELQQISHNQNLQDTNKNHHLESDKPILQVENSDVRHFQHTDQSENARDTIRDHQLNTMDNREARGYRDRNLPPEFTQRIISSPINLQYRNENYHLQPDPLNSQVSNNDERQFQHIFPTEILQQRIEDNHPTKIEYSRDHTTDCDKILSPELIQEIAENVKQLVLKDLKKELISSTSTIGSTSETWNTTSATPSTTVTEATTTLRTTTTETTTTFEITTASPTTKAMPTTNSTPSTMKPTVVTALPVSIDLNHVHLATKAIEKIIELFEKFKIVRDKGEEYKQTFNGISDRVPSKQEYHVPIAMMPPPLTTSSQYIKKSTSLNSAPLVAQQYVPLPAANVEIAPSLIPHTLDTIDLMTGLSRHPKETQVSAPLMIQTNINEIQPLAIPMNKPEAMNVNIVVTTENPYWKMKERERWNFMLQYNKSPDKKPEIKKVNNIKTTYSNDMIPNSTPGNRFVNIDELDAIKNREKWLNNTLEAFDKSLQLSLMKELSKFNHKPDESSKYKNSKINQYNDLSLIKYIGNKYNEPKGTRYNYNKFNNKKDRPTEKYFAQPISTSESTPLLNFNFNNFNISRPEEYYTNAIVKNLESKLDDTVNKLNAIAKLKNLYKIPDSSPNLSDYDQIKIENPIIVTDLNSLYKYRPPETDSYDSGVNGNIFVQPENTKDFSIDKTIDRKISINQINNMNAILKRNKDNPVPFIHEDQGRNNEINIAPIKSGQLFNIPYSPSPLIDNVKSKEKYSDIPLFSHDVQNKNIYIDNPNQIYGKFQYLANKFNNRDDTIKDNYNKYSIAPSQIGAYISSLNSREISIKKIKNKALDYNTVPKYKNVYESNIYSSPNKIDNVRLKFENRDKFYQSHEAPVKKPILGKPYVSPYMGVMNMNSRYKNKIKESEIYHRGDENVRYKNKETLNDNGYRGHVFPTALGKKTRPRPTSELGVEGPNYAFHEYKLEGSESVRKPDLQKFNMDIKEYTNIDTHDKLEDDLPMSPSDCGNNEECILQVASRLQIPIRKIKTGKYDDRNFKDFLKTQQKVNQMLETILTAKAEKRSVEIM